MNKIKPTYVSFEQAKWSNRKEDKSKADLLKIWFEQFKKK